MNAGPHAPLLIPLAHGLSVGGVTMWAVRLANGLAARGRNAALLLHPEPADQAHVDIPLHPDVRVIRPAGLPPFGERPGDLSPYIPHYLGAVRRLAGESGRPVAVAPTMHGDCFGAAAAVALAEPASIRILGWQHSDIEYDARVLARYEPAIFAFVAVSNRVEATLRARLPARGGDIHNVACGVEVPPEPPSRPARPGEPLRLIYTGRIEHQQKRVLALLHMSDELNLRGIPHRLTAVGDGPAAAEFDARAASRPAVRRLPPSTPARIAALLAESDAFVLPSRYEGLSISMLEAMAAGCIPVLARTESGALQAVEAGHNGEIADVAPAADEREAGLAMAEALTRLGRRDRAAMSRAAHATVLERFSLERHVERVCALLDSVAAAPPRPWPADRPCAFTAAAGAVGAEGSGSVPPDGPARLAALLRSLAGRRIILHGAGQHTIQLAPVLASSPATIAAIADDDRQRQGTHLWGYPIIAPADAAGTGATDLIISSWMHQEAIYARRAAYESQGLRVHRMYEE